MIEDYIRTFLTQLLIPIDLETLLYTQDERAKIPLDHIIQVQGTDYLLPAHRKDPGVAIDSVPELQQTTAIAYGFRVSVSEEIATEFMGQPAEVFSHEHSVDIVLAARRRFYMPRTKWLSRTLREYEMSNPLQDTSRFQTYIEEVASEQEGVWSYNMSIGFSVFAQ